MSLLEVLFSMTIFGCVLIMFAATLPSTFRGSGKSANYLQAALLARHKIEQLRQSGYNHLNGSDLYALGIVDSATAGSDGSYSFSTVDHLVTSGSAIGYFGSASNATGKIFIGQALSSQGSSAPATRWAEQVTVTIAWSGGGTVAGSFTTHTILATP
jgi:Tfp pilus assembly protein PilV